jgi:MFS family permease
VALVICLHHVKEVPLDTLSSSGNRPGFTVFLGNRKVLMVLYSIAVALFWISLYLYVPTLSIYVKGKVNDLGVVGLILSMYGLWQAFIRFPLGIASDGIGWRKPFILIGFVFSALGAYVMAVATNGAGLTAGRAITGLAAGTWVPMVVVFSALFPPEEAVRSTAILTMVNSLSIMVATALTGWLNHLGGYSLAFFSSIGVAAAGILVILAAQETRTQPKPIEIKPLGRLISRSDVYKPAVLGALTQFLVWSTTSSFTAILAKNLGASDVVISILTSSSTGVILLGNLATATLTNRIRKSRLAGIAFIAMAAGAVLAAASNSLVLLFVAQYIVNFASGINHPLLMGMSIEKVDGNQRATAMGLHQAVYGIGMFIGPWIGGRIAEWMGLQPMFAYFGLICLVLGLLGVRWLNARKQLHV